MILLPQAHLTELGLKHYSDFSTFDEYSEICNVYDVESSVYKNIFGKEMEEDELIQILVRNREEYENTVMHSERVS